MEEAYKPKNVVQRIERNPKKPDTFEELKEKVLKTVEGKPKQKKEKTKNG